MFIFHYLPLYLNDFSFFRRNSRSRLKIRIRPIRRAPNGQSKLPNPNASRPLAVVRGGRYVVRASTCQKLPASCSFHCHEVLLSRKVTMFCNTVGENPPNITRTRLSNVFSEIIANCGCSDVIL